MTPNEKPASPTQGLTAAASERLQGWLSGTFAYTAYRGRAPDGVPQLRSDIRAALSALDRTTLPPAEGMVLVPRAALDWLNGEGPDDDGVWFGDAERAAGSGSYWWRTVFNRMRSTTPQGSLP